MQAIKEILEGKSMQGAAPDRGARKTDSNGKIANIHGLPL
jgi:hypothetical protein